MGHWIKCKDRMPDAWENVIAYFPKLSPTDGRVRESYWFRGEYDGEVTWEIESEATHWQPLPEPPEED